MKLHLQLELQDTHRRLRDSGGDDTVLTAVTRVALRTTTGTQDITIPGFGTPKAALFITSFAEINNTITSNYLVSFGATDGTNQWVTSYGVLEGGTAGVKRAATDEVIMMLDGGNAAVLAEANFDSWITDGVRINIGANGNARPHFVTVVLFRGDDLTAKAGVAPLATQNNSVTVTPGFQVNALFCAAVAGGFGDTATTGAVSPAFGVASYDGTTVRQVSYSHYNHNSGTGTVVGVRDNSAFDFLSGAYAELHSITATEFQLRSIGASLAPHAGGYLALNFGGAHQAWAGVVDSPTTTGDHDFDDPGFEPIFSLMVPTTVATMNTNIVNTDGAAWGVSVITENAQFCNSWRDQAGAAVSKSLSVDEAINLDDHTGGHAFDATFVNQISTGTQLNFTTANSTVRKWPVLFIR